MATGRVTKKEFEKKIKQLRLIIRESTKAFPDDSPKARRMRKDSFKLHLRKVHDGNMGTEIDSTAAWQGGASGAQAWGASDNILSNGAYHVEEDYGFVLWADCVNDDNMLYFEYFVRCYWHKL